MQQWINMAPRARAAKLRTVQVLDVEEEDADRAAEEEQTRGIPLFEGLQGEVHVEVYRLEPIEEGTVGTLPADADEATIRRRWGGGVFRVVAKGTDGKFQRRQRTITIAGDPKFESMDAKRKYKIKMSGIEDDPRPPAPAPAPPPGMGIAEVLALVTQSHGQQMEMMRLQVEAARANADDRERRARADGEEREARLRREADERLTRDQQFHATMLQMVKSDAKDSAKAADPMQMIELLLKGLALGREMGGGGGAGESDPVTAFIQNLPTLLPQAQAMLQSQGAPRQATPAPAPEGPPRKSVTLTGAIAEKLEQTVRALQKKGYHPEQAIALALEQLGQLPAAPTEPAPKPETPPPPEAPRAAAPKATKPRARASVGR